MESQFNVGYGSSTPNQEAHEVSQSTDRHVPPPYWQFVNGFKQQMGEDAEPDALFFVESWMLGASAAIENLKQRREAESKQTHIDESVHLSPDSFVSEPFGPSTFGEQPFSTESFSSDSYLHERQRQTQFCTSHYAVPPASPVNRAATCSHRKLQDKSESRIDDFECESSNQPMTKQRALHILGVAANSTRTQIKSAFRRLVNEWHPDRFEWRTERARQVATEKMSSINKAYQLLRSGV